VEAAETLDDESDFQSWQQGTFRKIGISEPLYGIYFKINNRRIMGVIRAEAMKQFWQKCVDDFTDKLVSAGYTTRKEIKLPASLKNIEAERLFSEKYFRRKT